jgi:uncharacterized protein
MMPKETALESVRFLLKNLKESRQKEGSITFLGGEPLLNWEVIRASTEYAVRESNKANKKISFSITTNGLLLNKANIAFMRRYNFSILLTIDSEISKIHDRLRPTKNGKGSFRKIIRNLKLFRKSDSLSVTATLTRENLKFFDYLRYFLRFGPVKSIDFGHLVTKAPREKLRRKDIKRYKDEMRKYADYIIESWEKGKVIRPQNAFLELMGLLENRGKLTSLAYCQGGREHVSISSDGGIYACAVVSDIPEFYLGDVFAGIDPALRDRFIKKLESRECNKECFECSLKNICNGCFAASYILDGKIKKANETCEFLKFRFAIAQELLDKLNELIEEN